MTEENKVTENEELPEVHEGGEAIDLWRVPKSPEARSEVEVELPFIAPRVEDGYPVNAGGASVSHFKIRLMAMQHYVRCCAERLGDSSPVKLFKDVPDNNHGFGSFIVAHLDGSQCVYSVEYVSCDAINGMQTRVIVPSRSPLAVSAEWGEVALKYEDLSQLQRWGQTILDHRWMRHYKNTELFDLLANVPPQR